MPTTAQATPATRKQRHPANAVALHLLRYPTSIGNIEALAGVNPQDKAERAELWNRHQHLFAQPGMVAMRAVMDDCKKTAAQRLERGEFCLYPRTAA